MTTTTYDQPSWVQRARGILPMFLKPSHAAVLNAALTPDAFTPPLPKGPRQMSERGMQFLYDREAMRGVSERLHWPGGASGVTLGPGYDMKGRTRDEVRADLERAGVAPLAAELAAGGAGLSGGVAKAFAYQNRNAMKLTPDQERRLMELTVVPLAARVDRAVTVPLTQGQYDALVSLAYNIGKTAFAGSSVLHRLNARDYAGAQAAFAMWRKSGGRVVAGLEKRRAMEMAMFGGAVA